MATDDSERITSGHWPPPTRPPFPAPTQGFPTPGKPGRDRRGLAIALVALAATVLIGGALAGGGYFAYAKLTATSTFDAHGQLVLTSGTGIDFVNDTTCQGIDGYSDIAPGATVTVRDSSGKPVAIGALEGGRPGSGQCSFPITVEHIPAGSKIYSFEVSHRGQVTMSRSEAARPQLTLGS